ncbi:hypothetical protein E4V01_09645 [Methylorubrum sp. Q1]|nr:hypothetical protein E4V01_09645 [Methylorubrum sp. Q1]
MSHRQPLKNALHHTIGYVETESDGRQILLDPHFRRIGYFDPNGGKYGSTKDRHFRTVGQGNLLTSLLGR